MILLRSGKNLPWFYCHYSSLFSLVDIMSSNVFFYGCVNLELVNDGITFLLLSVAKEATINYRVDLDQMLSKSIRSPKTAIKTHTCRKPIK